MTLGLTFVLILGYTLVMAKKLPKTITTAEGTTLYLVYLPSGKPCYVSVPE